MEEKSQASLSAVSSFEFNLKFNDRCFADWGKTDLISVVGPEGIYVIELQPEDDFGPFQTHVIKNPKTRFEHEELSNFFPKFDSIWQTLDQRQHLEIFLNPSLMTNVESLSLDLYPRRFKIAKWSPLVDIYPRQCLLAAITIDNQLLIYSSSPMGWTIKEDLSEKHDKFWFQNHQSCLSKSEKTYEQIRHTIQSLSFCYVCWKETTMSGPLLIAATITGDIVIWLVQTSVKDNKYELSFDIKVVLRTELFNINGMQVFKELLLVSTLDGQLIIYDLTIHLIGVVPPKPHGSTKNSKALSRMSNIVSPQPTSILWHRDNIEISDFCLQTLSPTAFRICLSKSTNICWCTVDYIERNGNEPAKLSVGDSFSAIDGLDTEVSLHQTPAIWLKSAGNSKAVFTAEDGSFFQIQFANDRPDESPEFNSIRTGKVNLSCMVPRGLCVSPQGNFVVLISSISFVHDHAKIPSPTKLVALPLVNDRTFYDDCLKKMFDDDWLEKEQIQSPLDVSDRMNYLRSLLPIMNSQDFSHLFYTLKSVLYESEPPKNFNQVVKFKIAGVLMRKLIQHSNITYIDTRQRVDVEETAHAYVLLWEIERVLELLFRSSASRKGAGSQKNSLTENQINTLRHYFEWLEKDPKRSHVRDQYIDKFKELDLKHEHIPPEQCHVCKAPVPFEFDDHGTCVNGHIFDRCARTLLIVDIRADHQICYNCCQRFINDLLWPPRYYWLCLFCQ